MWQYILGPLPEFHCQCMEGAIAFTWYIIPESGELQRIRTEGLQIPISEMDVESMAGFLVPAILPALPESLWQMPIPILGYVPANILGLPAWLERCDLVVMGPERDRSTAVFGTEVFVVEDVPELPFSFEVDSPTRSPREIDILVLLQRDFVGKLSSQPWLFALTRRMGLRRIECANVEEPKPTWEKLKRSKVALVVGDDSWQETYRGICWQAGAFPLLYRMESSHDIPSKIEIYLSNEDLRQEELRSCLFCAQHRTDRDFLSWAFFGTNS